MKNEKVWTLTQDLAHTASTQQTIMITSLMNLLLIQGAKKKKKNHPEQTCIMLSMSRETASWDGWEDSATSSSFLKQRLWASSEEHHLHPLSMQPYAGLFSLRGLRYSHSTAGPLCFLLNTTPLPLGGFKRVMEIVLPPLSPLEVVAPAYWMRQWGGRPLKEACTATAFVIFPL